MQEELTLTRRRDPVKMFYTVENQWNITQEYKYQNDIDYHDKYTLNWVQCIEKRKKQKQQGKQTDKPLPPDQTSCFEYVTNLPADRDNVMEIARGGRLRWKIENEGFNTQKCGGYELEHKYCRLSYTGLKNYYSLLLIAHAINQLLEKDKCVTDILKQRPKETLSNLWEKLKGFMLLIKPDDDCYGADDNADDGDPLKPAPS